MSENEWDSRTGMQQNLNPNLQVSLATLQMAEEGKNQPLKLIRSEDEDEDRISRLPDCLIVEILSHLPETKYSVRTCVFSKRWEHIWQLVPNLIFLNPYDMSPDLFSFVEKVLTQRGQLKLKKFKVCCEYRFQSRSQIHKLIQYAINCNVEELHLRLWNRELKTEFPLDQLFFTGSSFTDLNLSGCIRLNPTGAIRWKNIRSLCISHYMKLDEGLIENILSGNPVLETLELKYCSGDTQLNITSKSVKNLVFSGHMDHSHLEINAPNILSLTIKGLLWLRNLLLLNVSSLVEADINYWYGNTAEYEEEILKGFILKLRHVKVLKIGVYCCKVLNRLEAKGFIRASNLKVLQRMS